MRHTKKTGNQKDRIKLKSIFDTFQASNYFKNLETKMKTLGSKIPAV